MGWFRLGISILKLLGPDLHTVPTLQSGSLQGWLSGVTMVWSLPQQKNQLKAQVFLGAFSLKEKAFGPCGILF